MHTLNCFHFQVHLPNLKWVDNHRPVFRISLKMVSSIYPQDSNLISFLDDYYTYNSSLGSDSEEVGLVASIRQVEDGSSEPLVQFLHLMLNSLCTLLVRPTVSSESGMITCTHMHMYTYYDYIFPISS